MDNVERGLTGLKPMGTPLTIGYYCKKWSIWLALSWLFNKLNMVTKRGREERQVMSFLYLFIVWLTNNLKLNMGTLRHVSIRKQVLGEIPWTCTECDENEKEKKNEPTRENSKCNVVRKIVNYQMWENFTIKCVMPHPMRHQTQITWQTPSKENQARTLRHYPIDLVKDIAKIVELMHHPSRGA